MRNITFNHLRKIFVIFLVLGLAVFLRLRAVDLLPIDYDEDDYLLAAQQYARALNNRDIGGLIDQNYRQEHPPLSKLVYGFAIFPLPQAPEISDRPTTAPPATSLPEPHFKIARLTGASINIVTVFALAILNPLAGFFLAIHTYTIKYTSQVMLEALPMLTSALTVLFYLHSKRKANMWLWLSAIALGLTASGKYMYCIVGVAVLIDWLLAFRRESSFKWRNVLLPVFWGLVAVGIFFATNPYLWHSPLQRLSESLLYHGGYAQSDAVRQAGFPLWQPFVWMATSVPWHPGVFVVGVDILLFIFGLLGLSSLKNRYPVFFLWLGIGVLFLLVWPTKWPQYILLLMVPFSLSAGIGLHEKIVLPVVRRVREFRQPKIRTTKEEIYVAREMRQAAYWLLPGLIVLAVITLFPLVFQLAMSLTDFSSLSIRDGLGGGVWRELWMGLTGQVDPVSPDSIGRSRDVNYLGPILLLFVLFGFDGTSLLVFELIWTVLSVSLQTGVGFTIALILNRKGLKFTNLWRGIYILPWAIPEFVGALMWMQIFDPRFGWLQLASQGFFQRVDLPFLTTNISSIWRENPNAAMLLLLVAGTWYGFPFMMLASSAALKLIPEDVYEAAAIDGANSWHMLLKITWPLILPLLAPAIIIRSIFTFNQFYLFTTLQPPDPLSTFATISYYFFNDGGVYSVSAAINIITIVFLILGIILFNRWTKASKGVTYV